MNKATRAATVLAVGATFWFGAFVRRLIGLHLDQFETTLYFGFAAAPALVIYAGWLARGWNWVTGTRAIVLWLCSIAVLLDYAILFWPRSSEVLRPFESLFLAWLASAAWISIRGLLSDAGIGTANEHPPGLVPERPLETVPHPA